MGICGVDAGFALRPPLTRGPARQIVSLSSRTVLEGVPWVCPEIEGSRTVLGLKDSMFGADPPHLLNIFF